MPLRFGEFTDLVRELERVAELVEFVGPFEMMLVDDLPAVIVAFREVRRIFGFGERFVVGWTRFALPVCECSGHVDSLRSPPVCTSVDGTAGLDGAVHRRPSSIRRGHPGSPARDRVPVPRRRGRCCAWPRSSRPVPALRPQAGRRRLADGQTHVDVACSRGRGRRIAEPASSVSLAVSPISESVTCRR